MDKLVPLIRNIAAIAAKINPVPYLDMIEKEYGRTARNVVVTVAVLVAVLVLGYNLPDVLNWAGVK